mmetsp:Transcript_87638/g.160310  ORF Transcript_87638/g.160310 Transcript_87638/m.160310 type:complete len:175 (-) Transcript_87638:58-582(-)
MTGKVACVLLHLLALPTDSVRMVEMPKIQTLVVDKIGAVEDLNTTVITCEDSAAQALDLCKQLKEWLKSKFDEVAAASSPPELASGEPNSTESAPVEPNWPQVVRRIQQNILIVCPIRMANFMSTQRRPVDLDVVKKGVPGSSDARGTMCGMCLTMQKYGCNLPSLVTLANSCK